MEILENIKDCCGCFSCYNACTVQAIEMKLESEGFVYPVIDASRCIKCNKCRKVCPIKNIPVKKSLPVAYGCYAKDENEHITGSSGGFFGVLARNILRNGGKVCGAAYADDMSVRHILISEEADLEKIKGTKYVQSLIGDTYTETEKALKENFTVLFSGTPCQVAGLKSYLAKDYDNLITVDLICHGVPSPEIWKEYLGLMTSGEKVTKVNFREKSPHNSEVYSSYYLDNGDVIREPKNDSLYLKGFIQNLYLRESCFNCHFKGYERCSDFTIGDFWSVKEYYPTLADKNGVSAVLLHTEKAKKIFDSISDALIYEEAKKEECSVWNECLLASVNFTDKREKFYTMKKEISLLECIELLTKEEPKKQKNKLKDILRKIKRKLI